MLRFLCIAIATCQSATSMMTAEFGQQDQISPTSKMREYNQIIRAIHDIKHNIDTIQSLYSENKADNNFSVECGKKIYTQQNKMYDCYRALKNLINSIKQSKSNALFDQLQPYAEESLASLNELDCAKLKKLDFLTESIQCTHNSKYINEIVCVVRKKKR